MEEEAQSTDLLSSISRNKKVKESKIQLMKLEGDKETISKNASPNLLVAYTTPEGVLQETTPFSLLKIFKLEMWVQEITAKANPNHHIW